MKIDYLADQRDLVPKLSEELYRQFGYLAPHRTQKDFEERMLNHCNKEKFPITFVALEDNQLVGTFSFRQHDMETHKHFFPWIGSVFVDPLKRNQGIGSKLMHYAEMVCKQQNIKTLYLFTPDKQIWYQKLGWERVEETTFNGHPVTIMKKQVNV